MLGIVGKGFVGNAVFEGMRHSEDILAWDAATEWHCAEHRTATLQDGFINDIHICSVVESMKAQEGFEEKPPLYHLVHNTWGPIFICVPTPMRRDGSCDVSIVECVVRELNEHAKTKGHPVVVVIKSTVVPGTTARLDEECDFLHVCFNPEFLYERSSVEDFKNQDRIIIGGPRAGTAVLKQLYERAYPQVPVTKTSSTIAEMVKYTTNCFLATKVALANEFKQICDTLDDVDYDKVVEYATKDKRLGQSHWAVPGPDGQFGFGGSCFPKDLNALMALASEQGVKPTVMSGVWEKNLELRPGKDWEQLKGRAVTDD
tara:strand:- start:4502 stop:5449 length:948 start_codon:yes stop_codon:yes gene_type:complete